MNPSDSASPVGIATARRLAIVVSHPIQYYAPWFRQLAAQPDLSLRVFYLSDHGVTAQRDAQFGTVFAWDTDLLAGYPHEFVPNRARHPGVSRFNGLHNPGLRFALKAFQPDAILLFGYAYRTHLNLIMNPPSPVIFRGDSHLLGAPPPRGIKRFVLRRVFARCDAFLPTGRANTAYFQHYGVPVEKLFPAPHAVDADHFTITPDRLAQAATERASLGIPADARVVLFAGKLTAKKRPDLLLAAFVRAAVPGTHLVFAGDGEARDSLRAAARAHGHVHFLPFANQSAMPARYLVGDVFVLPSEGRHETWGLAINETMHMARPCIVSDQVGCHADLIASGKTGWIFPAGDEAALAATLRTALSLPDAQLAACGRAAAARVADFSYAAATAGLLAALDHIISRR